MRHRTIKIDSGYMMDRLIISQKLLTRRIRHLSFWGKCVFGLSLLASFILYGAVVRTYLTNPLADNSFLEVGKCPACYGTHHCEDFKEGKIQFADFIHARFLRFLNVKNVYRGWYDNKYIVLKKLAHNTELERMDREICNTAKQGENCDVRRAIRIAHTSSGKNWFLERIHGISDMTACPTQRLLDRIMDNYHEKIDAIDLSATEKLQVIYTLMVSSEPIILQTFPRKADWPFPAYISACGRFIAQEYVEHTLGDYYDAPWEQRVKLAFSLLLVADMLTDNDSQFGLYLMDLSYENLGVDKIHNVLILDAENIIVVDKWALKKDKKAGWDTPYVHEFDECSKGRGSCLTTSQHQLCTHHQSDHNYYAVCRNILSSYATDDGKPGGLLHDLPEEIESRHELKTLLNECAKPTGQYPSRLKIKDKLVDILKALIFS